MVEIELTADDLVVHVKGADKLWAFKSELSIPLAHVSGAELLGQEAWKKLRGFRTLGTALPGVIAAGRFHVAGEKVFMDVHDPDRAIVIGLHDDTYCKLIVEVADPGAEVARITEAATG